MADLSGRASREPRPVSGAVLSLIAVCLSELRGDLRRLLDSRWDEPLRRRAEELASTILEACRKQNLRDLVPSLRAITNLTRLSKAGTLPVLAAIREKLMALIGEAEARLPRRSSGPGASISS